MNISKILQQMACLVLVMLFLVGCGASQAKTTLQINFDGESCTYEGPITLKAGPVTLLFINESEDPAAVYMVRHTGEETIQDMIDFIEEEPIGGHAPWTIRIQGVYKSVDAGETHTWEGVLEPGIHTMSCASYLGWRFGGGLTVED